MIRTMFRQAGQAIGATLRAAAGAFGYTKEMWSMIGGRGHGVAKSGKDVTIDAAYKVAAFKRGVQLISDYIGKTPFHVKAGNAKLKKHPAWKLVRRWAVWHQLSSSQFRKTLVVHALTRGNGYGYIERDGYTMAPLATKLLDPSRITPKLVAGVLLYFIDGTNYVLQSSDVIHIRGFSDNGYTGIDPISGYARDVLGLAMAQQDYAATYYAAGGVPSTYAHSATPLSNEVWKRLESEVGPLKNAIDDPHRIPVLEGLELKSIGASAEATQLLSSREFSLKDIANALGLTVHKLNGEGTGGYKSLEEENNAFRDDTLDPFLCQFESEFAKLLTEDEQLNETTDVEAVRESLTRTNMADRAGYLKTAIGGPWMTPAEGRDVDSLEPIDGAAVLYPPSNMNTPLAQDPNAATGASRSANPPAAAPAAQPETEGAKRDTTIQQIAALSDVFARMAKRLATQARKAATKPETFGEFCNGLDDRNRSVISAAFGPVVNLCCPVAGESRSAAVVDSLLRNFESQCRDAAECIASEPLAEAVEAIASTLEQSAETLARKAVNSWA